MSVDGINWFLTVLFNPLLLAVLLGFFFLGKLIGRMVSRPNIWKILILCYLGVFFFEPLRNLGWVLGGAFLLGFFSGTIRNLPGIIAWADGLGDLVFALKHRNAYEELRRQEERFEQDSRRAREEAARANTGQSRQQQEWGKGFRKAQDTQTTREKTDDKSSRSDYASFDALNSDQKQTRPAETKRIRCLKVLGLDPIRNYSPDELKAAYRQKVKDTHPDAGGSKVEFIEVVNAYEWLRGLV